MSKSTDNLYITISALYNEAATDFVSQAGQRTSERNLRLEAKIAACEATCAEYRKMLDVIANAHGQKELIKQYTQGLLTDSELRTGMVSIQREMETMSYSEQEALVAKALDSQGKPSTF